MPDLSFRSFKAWEQPQDVIIPADELIQMYESGYSGIVLDESIRERDKELFNASNTIRYGSDVCRLMRYEETAKGELITPFVHILDRYPLSLPGPAQERGDCVSHGQKNSNLGTMVLEAVLGKPDEVSNKLEECPTVSELGEKNGVLSTEALYWYRGYNGDGWTCAASARVSKTSAGAVLRQAYPEADIDLSAYSGSLAGKYGSRKPPTAIADALDNHLFREATEVDSKEVCRDLMARGFFQNSCGSEGFAKRKDENGVSSRSGSWGHSMAYIAVDDRPWAYDTYGDMLVLVLNSWGKAWNGGGRDIYDSAKYVPPGKVADWIAKGIVNAATGNIMIPLGAFWARWKDLRKRYTVAMAGLNGWERESLVDWLGGYR